MSTQTTNYLDIIERLPAGALLRLQNVSWDDYEFLLTQMQGYPGHRVTYEGGRLEIMSPRREHEIYKKFIDSMVKVLAQELSLDIEESGSATLRRKKFDKGAEPDESYHIQNAARVADIIEVNLETDPPPDLVVEIDTTNESLPKLAIYAALGVPEIWRYDGRNVHIYSLVGDGYEKIQKSLAFPMMSAADLTQYVEQRKTEGSKAALAGFRQMVRSRKSS
ncbi:MAG TPA: Uma2 family endonuclease [Pyrinomonadaceae bacterium]|nr:Uma2 family endonuclease [Pyrinomonadaceae bacterium]